MTMFDKDGKKVSKREEYLALTRDALYGMNQIVRKAGGVKAAYRARMAELETDLMKNTYTPDHIEQLRQDAMRGMNEKNAALHAEFIPVLEKFRDNLSESHAIFDMSDSALTNALKLIEMGGNDLGFENIQRINNQFQFNQPALRVLQSVYKSRGVTYDGGIDRQIYNLNDAIQAIGERAEVALLAGGSLNNLSSAIGKVAKLEGFDFAEELPDPLGFDEAARRGAGLA